MSSSVDQVQSKAPSESEKAAPSEAEATPEGSSSSLRGWSLADQQALLSPSGAADPPADRASSLSPIQRYGGGGDAAAVHAAAERGTAGGGGPLPHLDAIQASFGGHDVSGVQAHVGGAAAEAATSMGATAYATGNDVAFAGAPDLHTAAHEAAHVVQQRAGVSLKGGVSQAGDSYERHADQVADAVVAGQSAEGLLGPVSGGAGGGVQRKVVQRDSGGAPLFEHDGLELETETDGASAELTVAAHGAATDEQKVEALNADLLAWEAKRIEAESSLSTTREALAAAEAEVATSEYGDQEAQARLDALKAEVGRLEGVVEQARTVEGIRHEQVAAVASGTAVGDLTRAEGDPGIGAHGAVISKTTIKASADAGSASIVATETGADGSEQQGKVEVNYGDELSAGGSYAETDGTDHDTLSGKAKATEDGVVLSGSSSHREGDYSGSDEIDVTLEADQVAVGTKHERGIDTTDRDGNGAKASFSVSPGVGAKVEVKPNEAGTAYELTGELYFTVGVGGSASGQGTHSAGGEHGTQTQGSVGGSVEASYKGAMSFTKPLTAEEATAYAGELEKSGEGDSLPDYPWLASWKAAIGQALGGELSPSAVKDPAAAAGMRVGESYDFSRETDFKVCVEASLGIVSAKGSLGGKGTTATKVARTDEGVTLTQSFGTEATHSAGGTVTFEGVTTGFGVEGKEVYGASVTFLVAPDAADFTKRFGEIEAALRMATSVDDLLAAQAQFSGNVSEFAHSQGTSSSDTFSVGAGGGEIAVTSGSHREDERTQDGIVATGGTSTKLEAKAGDQTILSGAVDESGSFEANQEGVSADLTRTTDTTGLGLESDEWTASSLWKSLTGGGVKGALAERITVARQSIQRISVSPENMEILLTQRSHDESTWKKVYVTVANWQQWLDLRQRLISPSPSSADVKQYGDELATLIDHCDALADFMAEPDAYDTLEFALNRWGEGGDVMFGGGGGPSAQSRDLGVYVDWPSSISNEDAKYQKAIEEAEKARDILSALSAKPDPAVAVTDRAGAMTTELGRLEGVIEAHASEWTDSRARLEMMDALGKGKTQVRAAKEEVLAALDLGYDPTTTSVEIDESAQFEAEIGQLADVLTGYKQQEATLFQQIREGQSGYQSEKHKGEWFGGLWAAGERLMAGDWREYTGDYQRMVEQWVVKVKELRALHTQANTPAGDWLVSADSKAPRKLTYEPDIATYTSILSDQGADESFWDLRNDRPLQDWLKANRTY